MSLASDQITAQNFKDFYQQILPFIGHNTHTIGIGGGYAPIGTIIAYMGTTAPQDYLACDGSTYSIDAYKQLADFFAAQFGSSNYFGGDGVNTFAVPDLRGEFLRGTGTNGHSNQGDGANVGIHQDGTKFPDLYLNKVSSESTGSRLGMHKFPNAEVYSSNTDKKTLYTASASESVKKEIALNLSSASSASTNAFTSRPTNTSVLYCIKAVVAGDVYSTDERVVGTWIDGKPLYEKTVDCGSLPNATFKDVNHGISNINSVISVSGCAYSSVSGNTLPLPFVGSYLSNVNDSIKIVVKSSVISITDMIDYSGLTAFVNIRYTKTTD